MKFQPLADRVLIRPVKNKDITAGGIIIPDAANRTQNIGIIVALGDTDIVGVGDRVYYSQGRATELIEDGEKLLIIRLDDIWFKWN